MSDDTKISLPDGFEVVSADALPKITLDKQKRFYFNASIRSQLDLAPYSRVVLAYNPASKQLAVIKAEAFASDRDVYMLDKRGYASARRFMSRYQYPSDLAPYVFVYDRALSEQGAGFVFSLATDGA